MGRRLLFWLIGLPVAALAISFALSNRERVTFDLWPLPVAVEAPLFLAALGTLGIGLVLGTILGWLAMGPTRSALRHSQRHAQSLERALQKATGELARLKAAPPSATASVPSVVPAPGAEDRGLSRRPRVDTAP